MDRFLFALVLGLILLVGGLVTVLSRKRTSSAMTAGQLRVFPFLRKTLARKKDARGVLAAGIFAIALGTILLLIAIVVASRGFGA